MIGVGHEVRVAARVAIDVVNLVAIRVTTVTGVYRSYETLVVAKDLAENRILILLVHQEVAIVGSDGEESFIVEGLITVKLHH